VAKALFNKGVDLGQLGKPEDAKGCLLKSWKMRQIFPSIEKIMPIVLKAFEWDDGFLKKEGQTDADVD
jgi:hypothetical protein